MTPAAFPFVSRGQLRLCRVLVFDLDDTLVYTYGAGLEKINETARILNLPLLTAQQYATCYGRLSFEDCISSWFPHTDQDGFISQYRAVSARHAYAPVTDFGVLQRRLTDLGYRVGILTNSRRDQMDRKLTAARVERRLLDFIVTSNEMPSPKPSGECFAPVFSATSTPPSAHVYIADAPTDREACEGAGVGFIPVQTGPTRWPEARGRIVLERVDSLISHLM